MSDSMNDFFTNNNYGFSAIEVDNLGASEYTLVSVLVDVSGSIYGFEKDLEKTIKEVISSCSKSPRVNNLMVRLVQFNTSVTETHGFKLLSEINPSDYDNTLSTGGGTSLYDAMHSAIDATSSYAGVLDDQGISVNSILFVVTDGADNSSTYTPNQIRKLLDKTKLDEILESINVVLVGVNDSSLGSYFDDLRSKANLDNYISLGDVDSNKLAKLAQFISQSISSTSQSLGSGSSAQLSNFTF